MKENICKTEALLLDLDGTVYLDGELIGDVKNTLSYFREKGIKIVYLTNNSSRTDGEYIERLKNIGVYDEKDMVYSSLDASIDFIRDEYNGNTVYPVATASVTDELRKKGIPIVDGIAEIVLLTYDRELTYEKIVKANENMVNGAIYIATHPDITCPARGVAVPDLGSFMKMFKSSSGRNADFIIGKPYKIFADYIIKKLGVLPERVTMVGDRLNTDIAFGVNSGLNTVLVLTGDTDRNTAKKSDIKADIVLDNIDLLKNYI